MTTAVHPDPAAVDRFSITYLITVRDGRSIEDHVTDIAIEQTVETPLDCIPPSVKAKRILGSMERCTKAPGAHGHDRYEVVISYRCDITAFAVPQLFNVVFGNISLKDNAKILRIEVPASLSSRFAGPRHGVEGIRRITRVWGRPLACTAVKPMGLSPRELAAMAGAFVRGGVDLVKDDHSIADQHFAPFRERVPRVQEAMDAANRATGRHALYLPMVSGGFDQIEEQVALAARHGVAGALMAPMLVGPDTARSLSAKYGMVLMAHPALTGAFFHGPEHGMTPAVLLGTLFRLLGADISIFPNAGGRFRFTHRECTDLAEALREPYGEWKPSFPCPAGGMSLETLPSMAKAFGEDTVLLIGGALLQRSHDLEKAAREFMDAIAAHFPQARQEEPQPAALSACDVPAAARAVSERLPLLRCENYRWPGRPPQEYKQAPSLPFAGVTRHELVGRNGEATSFELRYFEISTGGFTSLEQHAHEHVVIGARGQGVLVRGKDGQRCGIGVNDIAYISPREIHQLRNEGSDPFGFYCIVDRDRDRPVAPER